MISIHFPSSAFVFLFPSSACLPWYFFIPIFSLCPGCPRRLCSSTCFVPVYRTSFVVSFPILPPGFNLHLLRHHRAALIVPSDDARRDSRWEQATGSGFGTLASGEIAAGLFAVSVKCIKLLSVQRTSSHESLSHKCYVYFEIGKIKRWFTQRRLCYVYMFYVSQRFLLKCLVYHTLIHTIVFDLRVRSMLNNIIYIIIYNRANII